MKNEASPKKWKISRNITLVTIILISIRYLFDENPFNDHIGWFAMLFFWIFKGMFDLFEDKRQGDKKSMVANIIFLAVGFGLLLWQSIKWIGNPPY
ncbi:hypothetical protein ACOJQI_11525 [Bacillus salacetis]|uniref:hypothetical protein n=1 Tax=Bacillus salacetis TaxID=2315464 RepID=UPI003BA1EF70